MMKPSRRTVGVTLAVAFASSVAVAACGGDPPPVKRAGLVSSIGPGPQSPYSGCPILQQSVISAGDPNVSVYDSGVGGVNIECSVIPAGADYTVNARITGPARDSQDKSIGGGTITIQGTFKAWDKDKPAATWTGVKGIFQRSDIGVFTQTDCTAGYVNDQGQAIVITDSGAIQPNIAPGRIWATLSCPVAKGPSDKPNFVSCDARVTFRLENCDQGTPQ
ncbi:hypothetical protein BH09MYX1_BH09MYX1_14210 [soil metagenome]